MEVTNTAIAIPDIHSSASSSIGSTIATLWDAPGEDSIPIENCTVFDRYIGDYNHTGLIPESPMCITGAREGPSALGSKECEEARPESPNRNYASPSVNYVPYELGECQLNEHDGV